MFKNQVFAKYQVVSNERELSRLIDNAEKELADLDDELTEAKDKYDNFEIAGIDPARGNVMVNTVFEWDPIKDFFTYTGRSKVYAEIMTHRGWSKEQMDAEIAARKSVIEALVAQDVHHYIEVSRIFHFYYIDPQIVLSNIGDLRSVLK